ncbi:unnamed protein product [Cuscuta campestris]|uniref:Uncharacterized protein n=1 Tax=Cuscuta campestris TaxID=132261 RepID=A0A484LEV6_9ASTE|nr:unnamed protein product [Cuscuta campestris]
MNSTSRLRFSLPPSIQALLLRFLEPLDAPSAGESLSEVVCELGEVWKLQAMMWRLNSREACYGSYPVFLPFFDLLFLLLILGMLRLLGLNLLLAV